MPFLALFLNKGGIVMKMPYRPILKIPKTKIEKVFDFIGIGLFLLSIVYIIIQWRGIPDEVPGHFNAAGEVDRWGSKFELLMLPIIGFFMMFMMGVFEKAPHMHNYPKRLNESNVEQFYLNSRKMLNSLKNICLIVFAYLNVVMVQIALGQATSIGNWFLPALIIAVLIPMGIGIYKQVKIK